MSTPNYIIDDYKTLLSQISLNYNNKTINVPNLSFVAKNKEIDIKNLIVTFVYFAARKNPNSKLNKDIIRHYGEDTINDSKCKLGRLNTNERITMINENDKKKLTNKINKQSKAKEINQTLLLNLHVLMKNL